MPRQPRFVLEHVEERLETALTPGYRPRVDPGSRHRDPWTSRELLAAIGRLEYDPIPVVARWFGRTPTSVRRQLEKSGHSLSGIRTRAHGMEPAELAQAWGVNLRTLQSWLDRGHIPATTVKVGGEYRRVIDPDIALEWLVCRGALMPIQPVDPIWRDVVTEARQALTSYFLTQSDLLDMLCISYHGLLLRRKRSGFPYPAFYVSNTKTREAWYARLAVAIWLDEHDAWTTKARECL